MVSKAQCTCRDLVHRAIFVACIYDPCPWNATEYSNCHLIMMWHHVLPPLSRYFPSLQSGRGYQSIALQLVLKLIVTTSISASTLPIQNEVFKNVIYPPSLHVFILYSKQLVLYKVTPKSFTYVTGDSAKHLEWSVPALVACSDHCSLFACVLFEGRAHQRMSQRDRAVSDKQIRESVDSRRRDGGHM